MAIHSLRWVLGVFGEASFYNYCHPRGVLIEDPVLTL